MQEITRKIVTELRDREAIRDCLIRYSRGLDRWEPELFAAMYWPEAIDEHAGNFVGTGAEFVTWLGTNVIPRVKVPVFHMLGLPMIQLNGSTANVETYFFAHRREGETIFFTAGRLVDKFEKRGDEWRIAHRIAVIDVRTQTRLPDGEAQLERDASSKEVHGKRGFDDPSYRIFPKDQRPVIFKSG